MYILLFLLSFLSYQAGAAHLYHPRFPSSHCQPLSTTFSSSSVSNLLSNPSSPAPFIAISPHSSYKTTPRGLELYLKAPKGTIKTEDGVNDKTAAGATINSTFTILHGKVSFQIRAPIAAGVVTAAILIGEYDEIDIEILGGDKKHWQTNTFVHSPGDNSPMYGVFSSIEKLPGDSTQNTSQSHAYTIDWDEHRIEWSIDGNVCRVLKREDTWKNGTQHYPSQPARIQLGIWDASSPAGTSAWAKGPINWRKAPHTITAVIEKVSVECPRH